MQVNLNLYLTMNDGVGRGYPVNSYLTGLFLSHND